MEIPQSLGNQYLTVLMGKIFSYAKLGSLFWFVTSASCPPDVNLSKEPGNLLFCIGRERARPKSQEDIEELCAYNLLERVRDGEQLQQMGCSLFAR